MIFKIKNTTLLLLVTLAFLANVEAADTAPNESSSGKTKASADVNLDAATNASSKSANGEAINEDTYFENIPNVLTVSRLSQPIADAPSAVTVIDKETIRAAGIIDLPEIFRLVPGFYVGINAGFIQNNNYVVSYHGMTDAYSRRMQVLIDGRSVYQPLFGGVQWSELPITVQDIERIEITRGPNAASYGANSFLGVINIITQQPSETLGNRISTSVANGRNEVFYRHGGKIQDFTYRVTVGRREDSGLDNRPDYKQTNIISAHADYRIDASNELEFQFGATQGEMQEGDTNIANVKAPINSRDIYNHFELIKWRSNVSRDYDFQLQAYHSLDHSSNKFITRPIIGLLNPLVPIDASVESERFDIEAQSTIAVSDAIRAVWGAGARLDKTTSPYWLGTGKTDHFNLQRLFGQLEWHPYNSLVLNSGAMLEHNDFTGTDISPRFSANFKLTPHQTIRVGISTATRTPTYLEEKFNDSIIAKSINPAITLINQKFSNIGNVNAETITSKEIAYIGIFGNLNIDARFFYDDINNLIDSVTNNRYQVPAGLTLIGTPKTFVNVGGLASKGFETQVHWKLAPRTSLIANYSHVNINIDYVTSSPKVTQQIESSAPSNTISALLNHHLNSEWDASLAYYQVGAVWASGDGTPLPINRRWDARLAHKFSAGRWRGEVSGTVQNLLNDHYNEFAEYNTMRRRAYLNLTLEF